MHKASNLFALCKLWRLKVCTRSYCLGAPMSRLKLNWRQPAQYCGAWESYQRHFGACLSRLEFQFVKTERSRLYGAITLRPKLTFFVWIPPNLTIISWHSGQMLLKKLFCPTSWRHQHYDKCAFCGDAMSFSLKKDNPDTMFWFCYAFGCCWNSFDLSKICTVDRPKWSFLGPALPTVHLFPLFNCYACFWGPWFIT